MHRSFSTNLREVGYQLSFLLPSRVHRLPLPQLPISPPLFSFSGWNTTEIQYTSGCLTRMHRSCPPLPRPHFAARPSVKKWERIEAWMPRSCTHAPDPISVPLFSSPTNIVYAQRASPSFSLASNYVRSLYLSLVTST
jgi:hypothetical protein